MNTLRLRATNTGKPGIGSLTGRRERFPEKNLRTRSRNSVAGSERPTASIRTKASAGESHSNATGASAIPRMTTTASKVAAPTLPFLRSRWIIRCTIAIVLDPDPNRQAPTVRANRSLYSAGVMKSGSGGRSSCSVFGASPHSFSRRYVSRASCWKMWTTTS